MEEMTQRQHKILTDLHRSLYVDHGLNCAYIEKYYAAGPANAQNEDGDTMLHLLAKLCVKRTPFYAFDTDFLKYNPDPFIKNKEHLTPRMILSLYEHTQSSEEIEFLKAYENACLQKQIADMQKTAEQDRIQRDKLIKGLSSLQQQITDMQEKAEANRDQREKLVEGLYSLALSVESISNKKDNLSTMDRASYHFNNMRLAAINELRRRNLKMR